MRQRRERGRGQLGTNEIPQDPRKTFLREKPEQRKELERKRVASYGTPNARDWDENELFALVRRAMPYRALAREDFAAAMHAMAKLRPHVDAFFDKVTVNAPEADVRANRLRLLNGIRTATRAVADFSRIEG